MHYRIFTQATKRTFFGRAPLQTWASLGLAIALIGVITGLVTLWPPKPGQSATVVYQRSRGIEKYADLITEYQPTWIHLPGTSRSDNGITVKPLSFTIVEQNGSRGQSNPPVNLYGAHLKVGGDFKLRATLENVTSKATLSLYGQVPIIYDEFRYEHGTLHLSFENDTLSVQIWNDNELTSEKVFTIDRTAHTKKIEIVRHDGLVSFILNDVAIGGIPEGELFKGGEVWFGASAENNEWLLSHLRAERLNNASIQVIDTSSLSVRPSLGQVQPGLQQLAQLRRPGFTIGAAVALAPLVSDPDYTRVALGNNFGSFTTENALKWQFVHPVQGIYDFREADAIVGLATRHAIQVHGHTLVFGEANPEWVTSLPTATPQDKQRVEEIMLEHITSVAGHYAGKIHTWDVVNEPLADYDEFEAGEGPLRNHIWHKAMGKEYIAKAFHAARAADPNAKLFINEFGLEEDGERWDAMYELVKQLKGQGVPIDGVGFQAHVYERADRISAATLRRHIQELAQLGLQSRISEMDVYIEDGQSVQAQQYSAVLQACLEESSCISFTSWGISDRYNMFRDDDGSLQYGQDFLWDQDMLPTPAVAALRHILEQ